MEPLRSPNIGCACETFPVVPRFNEMQICVCVCVRWGAGEDWVAALTAPRPLFRLYSAGGLEDGALSLPGPAVACCARGRSLAIAFHAGPPDSQSKTQRVSVQLLDVAARTCCNGEGTPVPLGPHAQLAWLGFADDDGCLLCMDTQGRFCAQKGGVSTHKRSIEDFSRRRCGVLRSGVWLEDTR